MSRFQQLVGSGTAKERAAIYDYDEQLLLDFGVRLLAIDSTGLSVVFLKDSPGKQIFAWHRKDIPSAVWDWLHGILVAARDAGIAESFSFSGLVDDSDSSTRDSSDDDFDSSDDGFESSDDDFGFEPEEEVEEEAEEEAEEEVEEEAEQEEAEQEEADSFNYDELEQEIALKN